MTPLDLHHALLVIGWTLHFAFVSFVVTGTGTVLFAALSRGADRPGPLERVFADWLPAALSGAITAAVVPLLFVQTLHPEAFYSASIVLFWRALPLLPALVGGFYLLYVVKARESGRIRAAAAAGSLLCWLFAAFTWTSIYMLTGDDWVAAFGGGPFTYLPAGLIERVVAWLGLMVPVGITGAAWMVRGRDDAPTRNMALAAIGGAALAILAGVAHLNAVERYDDVAWRGVTLAGVTLTAAAWLPALARNGRIGAATTTLASVGAVVAVSAAALLRESLRFPADDWSKPVADAVHEGQGMTTFIVFAVLVVSAVIWIFRAVGRDLRATAEP